MDTSIANPLTLRCGLTVTNRLVKAAMAEGMGSKETHHLPGSRECLDVYGEWARGGWGLVISGNVQVDPAHLGGPNDFAIDTTLPTSKTLAAFTAWASASSRNGTKAVVQLCHPGRQIAFHKGATMAPSAIPMDLGSAPVPRLLNALVFGTPRAMTLDDIGTAVRQFADAARVVADAGFAGVELHGAHGYLLCQFLSLKTNQRNDAYGGSAAARARIVVEIVQAIRRVVPATFCVGLKINSVDVGSAEAMAECMEQMRIITNVNVNAGGVDFLEVSGGSFEDPTFSTGLAADARKESTMAREAFFLEFAAAVRAELPTVPLLLTGGFRSRVGMEAALLAGSCDLVGLARPSVIDPLLPRRILLNAGVPDRDAVAYVRRILGGTVAKKLGVKLLGVGPERDWYTESMHRIGSVKSSIVVTDADSSMGTAIVQRVLSHRTFASSQYGVYLAENVASIKAVLGKVEAARHAHEMLPFNSASLASVRETANAVNRRVAAGFLAPIQALVLTEENSHVANFLLSLLLLQSLDKERGRIIVVASRSRHTTVSPSNEKAGLLHGASVSNETMLWLLELADRLANDPALANISVAAVDSGTTVIDGRTTQGGFQPGLMDKILLWLAAAMVSLLWPGRGNSKTVARDVVRVMADDRNGVDLCAFAVTEDDDVGADGGQRRRAWHDALVRAGVEDGDTVLADWR